MKQRRFIGALVFFLGLIAILLTVIDTLSFRRSFYEYEYGRDNTAERIGMSDSDLMNATDTLLDYLKDNRDDIIFTAEVNGYAREIFDQRETLHMIDVKNLYRNAVLARNALAGVSLALLGALYYMDKKDFASLAWHGLKSGLLAIGMLVGAILFYALLDFNAFWMNFHYVFFDNDLFLLDPNVSIMINMFPENFFSDLVMGIIAMFAVIVGTLFSIAWYFNRKKA